MKTQESVIVQFKNLSIGYKDSLVSDMNAGIKKGEIVLLAGKNGCGKTTLLKTILKEIPLLAGNIKVAGADVGKIPVAEIGKLISVVLSKSMISSSLKVFDLVSLGRYPYKKWYERLTREELSDIKGILNLLDLEKYAGYYVYELSDGNLQKALIARALVQDCPLLILDEPTSHLDMSNKLEIMRIINYLAKEKAKTILFTSHDLGLGLTVADKLWLIKENRLETGFTEDLANRQDILDYFAGASVRFDYRSNEYEFTSERTKKEVTLTGSSRSLYWLRKALIRNRFSINEGTDFLISEKDSVFVIKHSGKEYFFSAIEEVIRFLSA